MKKISGFFGRLESGDETEDGEDTSTSSGESRGSTLEGSGLAGGLSGCASARRSRSNDWGGAVGRWVGSNGNSRGLDRCNRCLGGSRWNDWGLGGGGHGGRRSRGGAVVADRDDRRSGGLDNGAS